MRFSCSCRFLLLSLALRCLAASIAAGSLFSATLDPQSASFKVVPGVVPDALAWAGYSDEIPQNGWAFLNLTTRQPSPATSAAGTAQIAAAAGFLEGYLTHSLIYDYWHNYIANEYGSWNNSNPQALQFLEDQVAWIYDQIEKNPDPYWQTVSFIMHQFEGLVQGFNSRSSTKLTRAQLYLVESAGDMETLNDVFPPLHLDSVRDDIRRIRAVRGSSDVSRYQQLLMADCSSLVRMLPGFADVVATQATWRRYYAMLRIWKYYDFPQIGAPVAFASSPLFIHSKDDYYTTGQKLVVMETTNNIFDESLYEKLTPKSLFTWHRAMLANYLARDGREWTALFSAHGSGTYDNQWIVLDLKRFRPGTRPLSGLLYIAEEIPGLIQVQDVTGVLLEQQYWPSYNIPYSPEIYNLSGYPSAVAKYGKEMSYKDCSRAQIFRRNATLTRSVEDVQRLIRYNDFEHDPLSGKNPLYAIASRGDLLSSTADSGMSAVAFGEIDAKVTSWKMCSGGELVSRIVCGPTTENQPVFDWRKTSFPDERLGLPESFAFGWLAVANQAKAPESPTGTAQ